MMRDEFMQIMEHGWNLPNSQTDLAKSLGSKFKNLRKVLRQWHNSTQSLAKTIDNNKMVINLIFRRMEYKKNFSTELAALASATERILETKR
jgi:hypothetical protein